MKSNTRIFKSIPPLLFVSRCNNFMRSDTIPLSDFARTQMTLVSFHVSGTAAAVKATSGVAHAI